MSEIRLKLSLETAPGQRPHGVLGIWSPVLSAVGNAFKIQVTYLDFTEVPVFCNHFGPLVEMWLQRWGMGNWDCCLIQWLFLWHLKMHYLIFLTPYSILCKFTLWYLAACNFLLLITVECFSAILALDIVSLYLQSFPKPQWHMLAHDVIMGGHVLKSLKSITLSQYYCLCLIFLSALFKGSFLFSSLFFTLYLLHFFVYIVIMLYNNDTMVTCLGASEEGDAQR